MGSEEHKARDGTSRETRAEDEKQVRRTVARVAKLVCQKGKGREESQKRCWDGKEPSAPAMFRPQLVSQSYSQNWNDERSEQA